MSSISSASPSQTANHPNQLQHLRQRDSEIAEDSTKPGHLRRLVNHVHQYFQITINTIPGQQNSSAVLQVSSAAAPQETHVAVTSGSHLGDVITGTQSTQLATDSLAAVLTRNHSGSTNTPSLATNQNSNSGGSSNHRHAIHSIPSQEPAVSVAPERSQRRARRDTPIFSLSRWHPTAAQLVVELNDTSLHGSSLINSGCLDARVAIIGDDFMRFREEENGVSVLQVENIAQHDPEEVLGQLCATYVEANEDNENKEDDGNLCGLNNNQHFMRLRISPPPTSTLLTHQPILEEIEDDDELAVLEDRFMPPMTIARRNSYLGALDSFYPWHDSRSSPSLSPSSSDESESSQQNQTKKATLDPVQTEDETNTSDNATRDSNLASDGESSTPTQSQTTTSESRSSTGSTTPTQIETPHHLSMSSDSKTIDIPRRGFQAIVIADGPPIEESVVDSDDEEMNTLTEDDILSMAPINKTKVQNGEGENAK
jgi:hypothetical protein